MPIDPTAPLAVADPEIAAQVENEILRQHEGLEMIASENFVSRAVLEAAGTVFTNKYAEGYPGKRYYGGCEFADVVENLARDRAKKLFNAEHANVQPSSGSQANAAAYMAIINPGDFGTNISTNELHAANSRPHSPYFVAHQRARDLYGTRIREAPPPLAVARLVDRLLNRRTLPVRLAVGSPVEKLGLTAKRLLSPRVFEYLLQKSQGL